MASVGQFLILQALGLFALAVFVLAAYLLYVGTRRRMVLIARDREVPPDQVGRPGTFSGVSGDQQAEVVFVPNTRWNDMRRRLIYLALVLFLLVFAGRFVVSLFFTADPQTPVGPSEFNRTVLEGSGGEKLEVSEYGAKGGPILLFTHGWGNDHRQWMWLFGALPSKYHLVAWDLPGLGASSKATNYSLRTMAGDLDRVVAHFSGKPVVLIGHSIGGMLNLELAKQHPEILGTQVRGIVEANTSYTNPVLTKKDAERSARLQKPVFEPLLHVIEWISPLAQVGGWFAYQSGLAHIQLAMDSFTGTESWAQLDEMASYSYRSSPGVIARGTLGMLHWDASDALPKINVPILVFVGDQDTTTLPSAGEHIAHTVTHGNLVGVDHAAHLGPVEQYKAYSEGIDAFAAKLFDTPPGSNP